MTTIDEWATTAALELSVEPPHRAEQQLILDVAREVAHRVHRPAAPLTAYLLGVAVGRGEPLEQAAAAMIALAKQQPPPAE
jgi:hypothetical protein